MKKSTVFCVALLSALAAPAYADGWQFVDGEAVWGYNSQTSDNKMHGPVERERNALQRKSVTADSWKQVDGEAAWLYVGTQTDRARADQAQAGNGEGLKRVDG